MNRQSSVDEVVSGIIRLAVARLDVIGLKNVKTRRRRGTFSSVAVSKLARKFNAKLVFTLKKKTANVFQTPTFDQQKLNGYTHYKRSNHYIIV